MSENYKPVEGDRVRVVIEGEVSWTSTATENYEIAGQYIDVEHNNGEIVSVEKIEPPVEVFKPGDVVRGLGVPSLYVAIAKDGYVNLRFGSFHRYDGAMFTSKHYEKVPLG